MELPFNTIVHSEDDTNIVAAEFSELLKPGDVVTLTGNLGSGKTFFVKSICSKFNIENVGSPSFSIVNEYLGIFTVYHFDFYRIKRTVELYDIGFEEYLSQSNSIVFIEWPEIAPEVIPVNRYNVDLEFIEEDSRKITIKKYE